MDEVVSPVRHKWLETVKREEIHHAEGCWPMFAGA